MTKVLSRQRPSKRYLRKTNIWRLWSSIVILDQKSFRMFSHSFAKKLNFTLKRFAFAGIYNGFTKNILSKNTFQHKLLSNCQLSKRKNLQNSSLFRSISKSTCGSIALLSSAKKLTSIQPALKCGLNCFKANFSWTSEIFCIWKSMEHKMIKTKCKLLP